MANEKPTISVRRVLPNGDVAIDHYPSRDRALGAAMRFAKQHGVRFAEPRHGEFVVDASQKASS